MMFRWINKQPGMQKFLNWCIHYQEIYDWINGQAQANTAVYGKNEYGNSGHLSIFTRLRHLMMFLKYNIFRA